MNAKRHTDEKRKQDPESSNDLPALNLVKILLRPDEQRAINRRVRSQRPFGQIVLGKLFELGSCLDDRANSLFTLKIDLAVAIKRRGRVSAAQALLPVNVARLCVQAHPLPAGRDQVELVAHY